MLPPVWTSTSGNVHNDGAEGWFAKKSKEFDDEWGTNGEGVMIGRKGVKKVGKTNVEGFDGFSGVLLDGFVLVDKVRYIGKVLFLFSVFAL